MSTLDYEQAGVNRDLADRFVEKIARLSKVTLNSRVKASIGGYASLFALNPKQWLAASTDGVGTKLKLAFQLGIHHSVGIDLVAMSVNDLLCVGAEPLFFLDYFATGRIQKEVAEQVISGVVEGCRQASCALVGGETAEMPDFYASGEYDLAGFAVGLVHPSQVLPRKKVGPGDVLIGLRSSGCHSNGYSLLRKLIADPVEEEARMRELLTPTRIYVKALAPLLKLKALKGLAHITGSGFLNLPRISDRVSYEVNLPPASQRPGIFEWVRDRSQLSLEERAQTFNLGVGMILVVEAKKAADVLKKLKRSGEKAWILGEVVKKRAKAGSEIFLKEDQNSVTLRYS